MVKNKEVIYRAFFENKKNKLYYNQLRNITSLSNSQLQNILKKLEENNEILKEKTKSNTYYKLTKKYKSLEFTKITFDLIENLNINVKVIINEIIKLVPTKIYSVIFFGSASKKKEQENSDIDLLFILENFKDKKLEKLYEKEIKNEIIKIIEEIETRSIYPISLKFIKKDDLKNNDHLIIDAINTGFPIINQLNYFENEY